MMAPKLDQPEVCLPADIEVWAGWSHLVGLPANLDDLGLTGKRLDRESASADLLKYLAVIHAAMPGLLDVQTNNLVIGDDVRVVIMNKLREQVSDGRTFSVLRRFLEVIDFGNRTERFRMRIPHLPAPEPPQRPSPFRHASFEQMVEFSEMTKAFEDSFGVGGALSIDAEWGRILFSALVYGGLTKPKWLVAIPEALDRAESEMRWLLLKQPAPHKNESDESEAGKSDSAPPPAPRRWFPDPLTRLLLARARQKSLATIAAVHGDEYRLVVKLVHAYWEERGLFHNGKRGFRAIALPAATRLSLHMPGWVVAYALERRQSTSLPDWSWDRLISPPTEIASELTPRERLRAASVSKRDLDEDEKDEDGIGEELWPAQLRVLGSRILEGDIGLRKRIRKWRKDETGRLLPSVDRVAKWAAEYLLSTRHGRHPIKHRALYSMINNGGSRVVGQIGLLDPIALTEEVLLEVYQNALEDAPASVRRAAASALKSFHAFLVVEAEQAAKKKGKTSEFPTLEESGIFNVKDKSSGVVDANIIGQDTFVWALRFLREEARNRYGEEMAECLVLVACLGYFTGLRRSEAIGICIGEILFASEEVHVLVRKNSLRGLKTRSGHRILPAMNLMPKEYWKLLVKWAETRFEETGNPSQPLFPELVRRSTANVRDPRLNLITDALQRAADDETLRFHHLRHSFASWTVLSFVLAEIGGAEAAPIWFLPAYEDRTRWSSSVVERKHLLGDARVSRRALLQVSHMLGHSGSDITLASYVHLSDFILGLYVRRLTPRIGNAALSALTGIPEPYIAKIGKSVRPKLSDANSPFAQFVTELADRLVRSGRHKQSVARRPKVNRTESAVVKLPKTPWQMAIHAAQALALLQPDRSNLASVATSYGFVTSDLEELLSELESMVPGIGREHGDVPPDGERFMEMPVGDNQLEMVQRTTEAIVDCCRVGPDGIKARDENLRHLETLLAGFGKQWVQGSYLTMRFDRLRDAKRWLWFVELLRFGKHVFVEHYPGQGVAVPSPATQRQFWKKALDVDIHPVARKKRTQTETRGVVRISIDLDGMPEKICPFKKPKGLFGVRFGLILIQAFGLKKFLSLHSGSHERV